MQNRGLVLIVEDEPLIRMLAIEMVEEAGFSTLDAGDVSEALIVLADREEICCVFSDINMPGDMNGIDLAAIVKSDWPEIHIILASGQLHNLTGKLGVSDRFLMKPYSFAEVSEALELCV